MADYQQPIQEHIERFNNPDTPIGETMAFMHPEMIWQEMPNLFVPAGRTHP